MSEDPDSTLLFELAESELILYQKGMNRLLSGKDLPLTCSLEQDNAIIFYESSDHLIHTSVQVFVTGIRLEYPFLLLTVERMSLYHTIPLPAAMIGMLKNKFPFMEYKDNQISINLSHFMGDRIRFSTGTVEIRSGHCILNLKDVKATDELFNHPTDFATVS